MTTERDIDQLLVDRVQQGDKKAFELLVSKYQRKLMRLVSRLIRDQAEAESPEVTAQGQCAVFAI